MCPQTRYFLQIGRMFYCDGVFQMSNCMAIWICEISERYVSSTTASFISFSKSYCFTRYQYIPRKQPASYRRTSHAAPNCQKVAAPLRLHYAVTDSSLN